MELFHSGWVIIYAFCDVVSRNIYEAIDFLDMKHGDRIGHAAAAGTDVKTWADIVGNELYMPQGTYMDDLIFANLYYRRKNRVPISCIALSDSKNRRAFSKHL